MVDIRYMDNIVKDAMKKSRTRKSSVRAELDDLWIRANAFGYGFNNLVDGVVRITDGDEDLVVINWNDRNASIESVSDRIRDTMVVGTDAGDALDAKAIGDALRALKTKKSAKKSKVRKDSLDTSMMNALATFLDSVEMIKSANTQYLNDSSYDNYLILSSTAEDLEMNCKKFAEAVYMLHVKNW